MLDVGSGSGYLTACLARANRKAANSASNNDTIVVGIEHQTELVDLAIRNINADDPNLIKNGELVIVGQLIFESGRRKFCTSNILFM